MKNETDKLEQRIRERFVKAFVTYHLLEDDDRVLVGLSGGKDSLCLLEMLAKRARISHPHFQVEALHVRMENIDYKTSTEYLERFCNDLNVTLHIRTTSFENNEDMKQKPACFLCSWNRRKIMFNLAQELGFNKIALGHHQDDLLNTTLMNLFYQGRFDTMPALLRMRKMPIAIIRPLCMVEEADIKRYAELRDYEKQEKVCPFEHDTNRTAMDNLFKEIERLSPDVRHSMWNALVRDGKLTE